MPPHEDWVTATGDPHNKFHEDRSNSSRDMLVDRQTDTHTDKLTAIPLVGRSKNNISSGIVTSHQILCRGAQEAYSHWKSACSKRCFTLLMSEFYTVTAKSSL